MIARAITSIIGVVIGLFATFAVFSAILGGLDSFYLLTQDACNYGSLNSPKRVLRIAPENPDHPGDADEIDWSRDGLSLARGDDGSCQAVGDYDSQQTYLTPTGDDLVLRGGPTLTQVSRRPLLPAENLSDGHSLGTIWTDGSNGVFLEPIYLPGGSATAYVFDWTNNVLANKVALDNTYEFSGGVWYDAANARIYALGWDSGGDELVGVFATTAAYAMPERTLALASNTRNFGLIVRNGRLLTLDTDGSKIYDYDLGDTSSYNTIAVGDEVGHEAEGFGINGDGNLLVFDYDDQEFTISPDYRNASEGYVRLQARLDPAENEIWPGFQLTLDNTVHLSALNAGVVRHYELLLALEGGGGGYQWIPSENVFTAQERLVTLLAVIAAIGMPIGAMTAIVFFGQAVISSGIGGQGASQVMVAIAAVVVILVSIQMFQQFAGFMGTAFDAVNGDRFVVFDETLGSLAETIAEFWGVLAFAGFINIAAIVWRNYSGNFSIGGTQGGL